MSMPAPQSPSAEAFALEQLRADPDLDYATLRQRASDAGIVMQPIHYGRARKQLGLTGKPPAGRPAPAPAPTRSAPARAKDEAEEAPDEDEADESLADDGAAEGGPAADGLADESRTDDEAPAAKPAARGKGSPLFDFALAQLRKDPAMSYGELRQRCEAAGYSLAPIVYGRAKAVLGLVPVKPRGKKAAAASPAPALPLQLKQVESVAADRFTKQLDQVRNIDELVAVVKELDAERRRLRDLLERIVAMVDEALGD